MERKFRQVLQDAQLDSGCSLLLAVSGGVDSVVLLDLLAGYAGEFGLQLQVFHLNHQIRPESDADAEFVRRLCLGLDISCRIESVDVPAFAKKRRLSLETAGREARRELMLRLAAERDCARIVLAHHQDDQAETFLQRLLRGSGVSGLQAMRARSGLWWRPLLGFSRQQIVEHARRRQLAWVEDGSNTDTRYLRNRIRHQLLPQLCEYNPQINLRLATLSRQFQLEEDFWQQQVDRCWPQLLLSDGDGLRLSRPELLGSHPALQIRLLREGLRRLRGNLDGIEAVHLEALHGLVRAGCSQAELDLPECWVARRYEQLWLRKCPPRIEPFDFQLRVGDSVQLPDGQVLQAELLERAAGEDLNRVEFDADGLRFPLQVRSVQPGDRFRPSGMQGRRKIKDFLIDQKVEKEQRQSLPILFDRDEVLWLAGWRRSAVAPVKAGSRKILAVRLITAEGSTTKLL